MACDEAYGADPSILDLVEELGLWNFAEVPHSTRVWKIRPRTARPEGVDRGRRSTKGRLVAGEPTAKQVDGIAAAVRREEWLVYLIKEDGEGLMGAEFTFRRVVDVRDELPGREEWLVLRRFWGRGLNAKTCLSVAPADTPHAESVRMASMRWPVETSPGSGKDGLGMGDYVVRSWIGWHHDMPECILAHHFQVRKQQRPSRRPLHALSHRHICWSLRSRLSSGLIRKRHSSVSGSSKSRTTPPIGSIANAPSPAWPVSDRVRPFR